MDVFDRAVSFLPPKICDALKSLPDEIKNKVYEVRLRACKPIVLITSDGSLFIDKNKRMTYIFTQNLLEITFLEIREAFMRLCNFSVYSHSDSISQGFITLDGGHRVGLCGTAVTENGKVTSMKDINSLNIRISREFKGCADNILRDVFNNRLKNVIISGPPSSGKTTLLRDISRQISDGKFGEYYKVAIIDERCEIAPVSEGIYSHDVGVNTDVLSGFKKADGIMMALRCLSPQLIVCDEIGTNDECEAIRSGINSGVNFVLSIHASKRHELENKIQFKTLIDNGFCTDVVVLSSKVCEIKETFKSGDVYFENNRSCVGVLGACTDRAVC